MEPLLDYLRTVNEISEEALTSVKAHYNLGEEIKKAEELKKAAAMDEDYEAAAKFKKLITSLKEEEMTAEKLRVNYIAKKPILRLNSLFEIMNKIDPVFTRNFL